MKLTKNQRELKKQIDMNVKMLFIVRQDLKMQKGKIAAQVGHCTIGLYKQLMKRGNEELLEAWENTGSKKIVTKIKTEKEMMKIKLKAEDLGVITHIVVDAGKTQVAQNSKTVVGFIGESNKLNQFTKNLKLM